MNNIYESYIYNIYAYNNMLYKKYKTEYAIYF